ncbi:tetratricopeptide (TPR) repeat protein [Sphingomonas naasensis]|uniref:Tetratricopeptide repeat protein n=1 Tax=Sphingomonas naasensis TaxID=1344951 RepID=A0A4S1WM00_9SPHN|nr:tetratricopeptide repeat protein [Sphingomonas naasensis]NIJ20157.1 tetratricopeptide (TPR) repeat protein [Sphingomonas naasensis]TGX44308.1 tetratricopeptide repeat protein [Sphingomonas naasensis]
MIRMHWLAMLALVGVAPAAARPLPALQQAAPAAPQNAPIAQETPEEAARTAKLGEALAAIQSGKAAEATAILTPLLAEYEQAYAGEKRKIYCAQDQKQTILYMLRAAGANENAIAIGPGWCLALWGRGFALIDQQQIDAAVPFLERAVAMSPSYAHYLSELGYAYQAQKKWQRSYDTYARAAEAAKGEEGEQRAKSLRRAWFGMGYGLIEMGKLDEAEKMFNQCLELFPDDQKVKNELQYVREQRAKKS